MREGRHRGSSTPSGSALREEWIAGLGPTLSTFRELVLEHGRDRYRDLPWRQTRDPYAIWVSEVMLQQTQTSRVDGRWQRWLERFPTIEVLAAAERADVLAEWQGLGYNRRALQLWQAAERLVRADGALPHELDALLGLPGIGPATAAGIRAFAFDLPGIYLETNVRSVFLHEFFPGLRGVHDGELTPLVAQTCPPDASDPADDPRSWYYALLDYGAHLKRTMPNPSRRSATHARQSQFEGSHRQKRSALVRLLLAHRACGEAHVSCDALARELSDAERRAGRGDLSPSQVETLLEELQKEGFCHQEGDLWHV